VTGSSSGTTTVSIPRAPSSTALIASTHVNLGSKTTYTAQVVPPASSNGSIVPSGTVAFVDGTKTIAGCGSQRASNGFATCTVKYTRIGNHRISSRYNGDGNFAASSSSTALVNVSPAPPAGYVTAFLAWTFRYHASYTKLTLFSLTGLSQGITISMACNGNGCPFAVHRVAVVRRCAKKRVKGKLKCSTPQAMNLLPAFRGRHLAAGTRLTVTITHPNWLGKYYNFTIRNGNRPKQRLACLAVNSTNPGYGCNGK
jgi:Bacterial Ig-like domain (group 3)